VKQYCYCGYRNDIQPNTYTPYGIQTHDEYRLLSYHHNLCKWAHIHWLESV